MLTSDKEAALLAQANKEKFAAVDVGGTQVLLTPHGELPSGEFLDPASGCALVVDHKALTAHKSGTPLSEQQLASAQGAASVRDSVDRAMQRYRSDFLPKGVVTTYGTSGAGTKVVCCVSAINAELTNYWAGQVAATLPLHPLAPRPRSLPPARARCPLRHPSPPQPHTTKPHTTTQRPQRPLSGAPSGSSISRAVAPSAHSRARSGARCTISRTATCRCRRRPP